MTEGEKQKLELLHRRFIEWLEAMEYSPKTRVNYVRDVKEFLAWIAENTDVQIITEVAPKHIHQYQMELFRLEIKKEGGEVRNLSPGSQACKLAAVKKFFAWLVSEQQLVYNPALNVQFPRLPRRLPRNILTQEEARLLIESTPLETPMDIRDRAILEILYSTGMRRTELRDLQISDVDLGGATLRIEKGKGGDGRLVPLVESAIAALRLYISEARLLWVKTAEQNGLFISMRSGAPLSDKDIVRIVQNGAQRAGITKHISPHVLRHSVATHLLKKNAGIRRIQMLLGHRRLSSTEIYTRVEISDLQEVMSRCHPREEKT